MGGGGVQPFLECGEEGAGGSREERIHPCIVWQCVGHGGGRGRGSAAGGGKNEYE